MGGVAAAGVAVAVGEEEALRGRSGVPMVSGKQKQEVLERDVPSYLRYTFILSHFLLSIFDCVSQTQQLYCTVQLFAALTHKHAPVLLRQGPAFARQPQHDDPSKAGMKYSPFALYRPPWPWSNISLSPATTCAHECRSTVAS